MKISSTISLSSKATKLPSAQQQGRKSSYHPEAAREIERLQLPPLLLTSLESYWAQHGVAPSKYECEHITRSTAAVEPRPPLFPTQP